MSMREKREGWYEFGSANGPWAASAHMLKVVRAIFSIFFSFFFFFNLNLKSYFKFDSKLFIKIDKNTMDLLFTIVPFSTIYTPKYI